MSYFEYIAPAYSLLSRCTPWRIVREMEERKIFQAIDASSFRSLLDIGCGSGHYMKAAAGKNPRLEISGCEPSPAMAAACERNGFPIFRGHIEAYPEKRTFDLLLCAGALEFIEDPESFFLKSRKLVSPSGKLVAFFPSRNWWGTLYLLFHTLLGNKVALRPGEEYAEMAERSGFSLVYDSGLSGTGRVMAWEPR